MKVGLDGDTRKFKPLRKSDHYEAKAAVTAAKHDPKQFVRCKTCGDPITGQNFSGYDHRCHNEPL